MFEIEAPPYFCVAGSFFLNPAPGRNRINPMLNSFFHFNPNRYTLIGVVAGVFIGTFVRVLLHW